MSLRQTREAVAGSAGPEHIVAVHQQRGNVLHRRIGGGNFPVAQHEQSAALGADPKIALRVFRQGADGDGWQTVGGGKQFPAGSVEAAETRLPANP